MTKMSLEAIVSRLEAQIAFDREREAFHAEKEAFHREQRSLFAAELEKLMSILESFKTAAATAMDLTSRAAAVPPPAPNLDIGRKPSLTRMVERILETRPPGDVFGVNIITAEVNRHYGERLRRPVKEKLVSIVLRRMLRLGKLRSVREGRPHYEALYARAEE
ncbi:MAG TPA: hypothetical protein VGG03_22455 [Thermoanaerobaculia bacterium]|jgi:hypothetical protein